MTRAHNPDPTSEDDYRKLVRLFREDSSVPHHTFPLPSEWNIHAVVRGVPVNFSDTEIKGELEQREYSPLHIIRLKRSGDAPMPLVVVILPKTEKSQQVFNEHCWNRSFELRFRRTPDSLGSVIAAKCLKCAKDHMTHLCSHTEEEERNVTVN
ncbi:unnamed protein product [Acanthoscelides obtectus]|uniref:Pre-C2HC domain-containing protein n=1 Tax=Acanthoscelides obtectus TaxID=200917 RepID=A0A9P0Q5B8_ACAOB|nr:unnamed protein product [Acanthoscelides obtectus]CAK1642475.1 hypothetical protein AOBTE_LOCUS13049 [Acanthoscelides obtectus]